MEKIEIEEPEFPARKWNKISNDAQDLIKKMLERDPKQRITFDECLKHRWFE